MITALIFTADWCAVCKQQKSIYRQLEELCSVGYIDIGTDHGRRIADEYRIMSVPAVIIGHSTFDEGFEPLGYFIGAQRLTRYKEAIRELQVHGY